MRILPEYLAPERRNAVALFRASGVVGNGHLDEPCVQAGLQVAISEVCPAGELEQPLSLDPGHRTLGRTLSQDLDEPEDLTCDFTCSLTCGLTCGLTCDVRN